MYLFLPHNTNQPYIYIYISLSPLPLSYPLGPHRGLGWTPCDVIYQLSTMCFSHDSVRMSKPLSQLVPLSPPPSVSRI